MKNEYLFLKGIIFIVAIWLLVCMTIITRVSYWEGTIDPLIYFQSFAVHQIWGVVATWLIIKYLVKETQSRR